MEAPGSITIRVYGLLIHDDKILLSRENIKGEIYTKFPGGGLETGEGIVDCLKREFREEVNIPLTEIIHFYTTEDLVLSKFHDNKQVISIYYKVDSTQSSSVVCGNPAQIALLQKDEDQILYWKSLTSLDIDDVDLPLDRRVMAMLLQNIR